MADRRTKVGIAAISAAVVLAVYELVAYVTDSVPTITEIIEDLPEFVEAGILIAAAWWVIDHFGWLQRP